MLKDWFALDDQTLFTKAKEISRGKKQILCSPNILTGECSTRPICRHCKWESFKVSREQFGTEVDVARAVERAKELQAAGIDRTFLASGWMGYRVPEWFYQAVTAIKEQVPIEVYGLFGALDQTCLKELKQAGMDGYLCSLESPNREVYRNFRPGGDSLDDRIEALHYAREIGLTLWSGFLCGLGETVEDMIYGLQILQELEVESLSILPFKPYPNTPMAGASPANPLSWARAMAVARLALPDADLFDDSDRGVYGEYSKLVEPNGRYTFPGKS